MSIPKLTKAQINREIATESSLQRDIRDVINRYSAENGSDTPDFVLAKYLVGCLEVFNAATVRREQWYGKVAKPVKPQPKFKP